METTVQKQPSSKRITSSFYDPRKVDNPAINWEKMNLLKERLAEGNNKTPFITCASPKWEESKYTLWYVSNWFTLILSPKPSWIYHHYYNKYS